VTKEPKLPDAYNKDKVQPSQIVVIVDEHDHIQVGSNTVSIGDARAAFAQLQDATDHRFKSVIIKADPRATYGTILQVMDAAKQVDLTDFGLANRVQSSPEGTAPQGTTP
ncbi:MAG TPA: biopolymer transporter ExbD, partial [Candidatus Cybelea sp.]